MRLDQPPAREALDDAVERAEVEPDALVLGPATQRLGHLVRMHRALVQAREDRQGERIGAVPGCHEFQNIRVRVLRNEYLTTGPEVYSGHAHAPQGYVSVPTVGTGAGN